MKKCVLLVVIIFAQQVYASEGVDEPSCSSGQLICREETEYPSNRDQMADFDTQVRLGYPDSSGSRVWVKGSEEFTNVRVLSEFGKYIQAKELTEPSYTYVFEGLPENSSLTVEFNSEEGETRSSVLNSFSRKTLLDTSTDYSVAFYGCFQPFTTVKDSNPLEPDIYNPSGFPESFLGFFSDTVTGTDAFPNSPLLPNTHLIVGTGDQVYMDAGYEGTSATRTNEHPLSAWTTTEPRPKLLREADYFEEHVELTYRAFGSFTALNRSLVKVPQVNVWDDHEIRDGWGSQGDEYNGDVMNPKLKGIFDSAKTGFIQHQYLGGPGRSGSSGNPVTKEEVALITKSVEPMHQTFRIGNFEGFAFDLRSLRNSNKEQVLDKAQRTAFIDWLNDLESDQVVILVSSMPVFLKNNDLAEQLGGKVSKEMKDDLWDGWGSEKNNAERKWLVSQLLRARIEKNLMPIFVSGDYHKGAISEIWYGEESKSACYKKGETTKKVFGYELLASGLYHEGIADGIKAEGFWRIESQRVGHHFIRDLDVFKNGTTYCLDPHVEISAVIENFGGLIARADPASHDVLRLITGRRDEKKQLDLVRFYDLKLDWDKPFFPKHEKKYFCNAGSTYSGLLGWVPGVDDIFCTVGIEASTEFSIN